MHRFSKPVRIIRRGERSSLIRRFQLLLALSIISNSHAGAAPPRVAICLIGGARHFELTASSLKRHVLSAYPSTHAFIVASLDGDAKKLALLADHPAVVSVTVRRQDRINETRFPTHILAVPNVQGQLHQFLKIEQCATAITAFETKNAFKYTWVLWTRLDTYWTGPPPPLESLDPAAYVVPCGSPWGGLNDRFGMARRDIAVEALKRLSSLHQLSQANLSRLNGEKALMHQLHLQGITATPAPLPFCVLSFRRKLFNGYVFAPLWSPAAAGGVSCRPCHPMPGSAEGASGGEGGICQKDSSLCSGDGDGECVRRDQVQRVGRCNPWQGYEPGWQGIFLRGASEEEKGTVESVSGMTRALCQKEWDNWKKRVQVWDCPSGRDVCGVTSVCTTAICKML